MPILKDRFLKNPWSVLTISFIAIFFLVKIFTTAKWETGTVIYSSDMKYYYVYLPAAFIYKDLALNFTDSIAKQSDGQAIHLELKNGRRTTKALMGVALLSSPFFFMAHLHDFLAGGAMDGYSERYEFYLAFSGWFWTLIGFVFLWAVLKRYFDDMVIAITFLAMAIGSNLMHYAAYEGMMSHAYSFAMASALLYFSLKWKDHPSLKSAIWIGLLGGISILIRPTNGLMLIVPGLLLINKISKGGMDQSLIGQGFWAVYILCLTLLPQMIYWKVYCGQFIVDTYSNEGFQFNRPSNIYKGLFSYRKGWLLYTPLMIFSLIGFYFFRKTDAKLNAIVLTYFIISTYVIFSWYSWWYGGSYGSRAMIDTYAFLSLPLAASFQYFLTQKLWIKSTFLLVIGFFIYLNLFQIRQYRIGMIHHDGMTKEAYWAIFLSNDRPENLPELIREPVYDLEAYN